MRTPPENRTGTVTSHVYTVEYDWDTADVTNDVDGGYEIRLRVTCDTDPTAFYVALKRFCDGVVRLRVHDRDLAITAFRWNDDAARAFMLGVEDHFLQPEVGLDALVLYAGYQNRDKQERCALGLR